MPTLKHPKWEQFAHLVAKGLSATEAYASVGYSSQGAHASAARLLKTAEVSYRVAELKHLMAKPSFELAVLDRAWVLEGLKRIARKAEDAEDFSPANRAYELLGKELGMFVDRKDLTVRATTLSEIPKDELLVAAEQAGLHIDRSMDTGTSSIQ